MLPVASHWFSTTRVDEWIDVITEPHVHEFLRCNIWHLRGTARDVVVDAGLGVHRLRVGVPDLFDREPSLLVTHAHPDHIGGAREFRASWAHAAERVEDPPSGSLRRDDLVAALGLVRTPYINGLPELMIDALPSPSYDVDAYRLNLPCNCTPIADGDRVDLGDRVLEVLHLPGHSPGSIALFEPNEGVLFSGDVVYDVPSGSDLLDEIDGADTARYVESLQHLADLPITMVYPGHGDPFGRARLDVLIREYVDSRTGARGPK